MLHRRCLLRFVFVVVAAMTAMAGAAQEMPRTSGETLSGKQIVVADVTLGHSTVLVAEFVVA